MTKRYARTLEKVPGVSLMDSEIPEAMWHLIVNNFVAIVTMNAHGNSPRVDKKSKPATSWKPFRRSGV